jgi:predicted RNA-binding Zn-ribbon protein involved in translation (DUF1610 family)
MLTKPDYTFTDEMGYTIKAYEYTMVRYQCPQCNNPELIIDVDCDKPNETDMWCENCNYGGTVPIGLSEFPKIG